MASLRKMIRHIFVWQYERGTLQYDIICALILAFIFFVPRSCFVPTGTEGPVRSEQKARTVSQPMPTSNEQTKQ